MLAANPTVLIPRERPACCQVKPHLHVVHASHGQVLPPQAVERQAGERRPQLVAADDGCAPIPGALRAAPVCSRCWFSVSMQYNTLHYITLHCITLHYITLHYITLHCIALHYITLHCIALHCIALHCIAYKVHYIHDIPYML